MAIGDPCPGPIINNYYNIVVKADKYNSTRIHTCTSCSRLARVSFSEATSLRALSSLQNATANDWR